MRGRKIRSEDLGMLPGNDPDAQLPAPGHPWRWQPPDADESALAAGIYFLEFLGGGGRQVKRVAYLH